MVYSEQSMASWRSQRVTKKYRRASPFPLTNSRAGWCAVKQRMCQQRGASTSKGAAVSRPDYNTNSVAHKHQCSLSQGLPKHKLKSQVSRRFKQMRETKDMK